jgi:hypothetical protein
VFSRVWDFLSLLSGKLVKATKIGIIVAALGAAIIITLFFGGEEPPPDDASTNTLWKCVECEHSFSLTARELDKEYERTTGTIPLYCPKCSKKTVYQPMACLRCNTLFFGPEVPGVPGVCPKCKPEEQPSPLIEEAPIHEGEATPEEQAEPEKPKPKSV